MNEARAQDRSHQREITSDIAIKSINTNTSSSVAAATAVPVQTARNYLSGQAVISLTHEKRLPQETQARATNFESHARAAAAAVVANELVLRHKRVRRYKYLLFSGLARPQLARGANKSTTPTGKYQTESPNKMRADASRSVSERKHFNG